MCVSAYCQNANIGDMCMTKSDVKFYLAAAYVAVVSGILAAVVLSMTIRLMYVR